MESDIESDLRFYFAEQAGAFGLRSNLGAVLDAAAARNIQKLQKLGGTTVKIVAHHCCGSRFSASLDRLEHLANQNNIEEFAMEISRSIPGSVRSAVTRANSVEAKLRRLPVTYQEVLRAQYSEEHCLCYPSPGCICGGISVSLALLAMRNSREPSDIDYNGVNVRAILVNMLIRKRLHDVLDSARQALQSALGRYKSVQPD